MGHKYQKGSKRPDPRAHRDKGAKVQKGTYELSGIGWPALGDGTQWRDGLVRVVHAETGERGNLATVEWCDPDGGYMPVRTKPATKTIGERVLPGAWWGLVAWDNRDRWHVLKLAPRHPLTDLLPEPGTE